MPGGMPPLGRWDGLWSAGHDLNEFPLDFFVENGLSCIPVAITPTDGTALPARNPTLLTKLLQDISSDYREVTEVRRYGSGIILKTPNLQVVRQLLTCTSFGTSKVKSFIPPHLACTKGVVRDVDASVRADEALVLLEHLGVTEVFRCSRTENGHRKATESLIVTFAGHRLPTEIKAWPLIFRVEPFRSRPLQCKSCFRFGHVTANCKSSARCRRCSDNHHESCCQAPAMKCCLCGEDHPADSADCPVREEERKILEVMDQRHCSRFEARSSLPSRSTSYAGKAQSRTTPSSDNAAQALREALSDFKTDLKDILTSFAESFASLLASQTHAVPDSLYPANMDADIPVDTAKDVTDLTHLTSLNQQEDQTVTNVLHTTPPAVTAASPVTPTAITPTKESTPARQGPSSSLALSTKSLKRSTLQTVSFKSSPSPTGNKHNKKKKGDILAAAVASSIMDDE